MKIFRDFRSAAKEAKASGLPLWDTHQLPERYAVGHPTVEVEEDSDNTGWEEIPTEEEQG